MNRGHENPDHQQGKRTLAAFWQRRGYQCFFEEGLADVVSSRSTRNRLRIVCSEYERSTRNVLNNVARDFRKGCDAVLIAVPNEKLRRAVRRKLQKHFPRRVWTKVAVGLLSRIQQLLKNV